MPREMLADLAGHWTTKTPLCRYPGICERTGRPSGIPYRSLFLRTKMERRQLPGRGSYLLGAAEFVCPEALPALQGGNQPPGGGGEAGAGAGPQQPDDRGRRAARRGACGGVGSSGG